VNSGASVALGHPLAADDRQHQQHEADDRDLADAPGRMKRR
jgi:hypothetical protein